ncbi:type II secretion system F family protein [Acanthopleuribacter pedis]|uniref:Type II secretion system F family protein n=1 Tax=Acanthopleuribacter pedis TaxID=442870 RepID=A0A8J7Q942_9BACT|nr:type II secretion system F family protein [Acanthopleuribacter pedis]MBO1319992.1 type II secretion system F family protein [Acanthopleuribacter pedis]
MARFEWKGKTKSGENQRGVLVAKSREEAEQLLKARSIKVSSIREEGKSFKLPSIGGGVSAKDVSIFTRQFSVMIDAGLPLIQCLELLGGQQKNKNFSNIIQAVRGDVESGSTLSDAMRKHPKAFDTLYVNMIAAGEAGGILDQILERLSEYIEKAVKLKSQVKSALVYPAIVMLVAGVVVFIILYFVIPTFASMFATSGNELPAMTQVTISASKFVENYALLMLVFVVLLSYAINRYYNTFHGRRLIDRILLKVPVLGMLLQKIAIARFCRTLGTLINAGVPILDGIEITARTSGNAIIEDSLMGVKKEIEEGKTIAEPLGKTSLFPQMVVSMISVGESTGALDVMLNKIADFYEDEVDVAVAALMSMLEPLLIVVLGSIIGYIVISLYLPIFQMANNA